MPRNLWRHAHASKPDMRLQRGPGQPWCALPGVKTAPLRPFGIFDKGTLWSGRRLRR